MTITKIENVRISATTLGREDHGILTAYIHVEGDGWGCGFGGYAFDAWDEKEKRRIGCGFGTEFIGEVLRVLDVPTWEKLPGTICRVETEGLGGGIKRIGHAIKDRWFDPKALATVARSAR